MASRKRYYHVTVHHRGFHFRGRYAAPESWLDRIQNDVALRYLQTTQGQGNCEGMRFLVKESDAIFPWSNVKRVWVDYPCLALLHPGFTEWKLQPL